MTLVINPHPDTHVVTALGIVAEPGEPVEFPDHEAFLLMCQGWEPGDDAARQLVADVAALAAVAAADDPVPGPVETAAAAPLPESTSTRARRRGAQ